MIRCSKLLQKNGQLSTVNGLAEQGELSLQEGAPSGQEEEVTVADATNKHSRRLACKRPRSRGKDADSGFVVLTCFQPAQMYEGPLDVTVQAKANDARHLYAPVQRFVYLSFNPS
ncbi:hypothetical protein CB1_000812037 [Camelus ferus]|nr:hypothetical protein CB1_000812037 [Camelus ferus]